MMASPIPTRPHARAYPRNDARGEYKAGACRAPALCAYVPIAYMARGDGATTSDERAHRGTYAPTPTYTNLYHLYPFLLDLKLVCREYSRRTWHLAYHHLLYLGASATAQSSEAECRVSRAPIKLIKPIRNQLSFAYCIFSPSFLFSKGRGAVKNPRHFKLIRVNFAVERFQAILAQ
jgi:hypothetical protein